MLVNECGNVTVIINDDMDANIIVELTAADFIDTNQRPNFSSDNSNSPNLKHIVEGDPHVRPDAAQADHLGS